MEDFVIETINGLTDNQIVEITKMFGPGVYIVEGFNKSYIHALEYGFACTGRL
jgi:hypothetical protein